MAGTTKHLDGRLAEVAGYAGDIGAAGFAALAQRAAPHEVSRPAFVFRLAGCDLRCPVSDITPSVVGTIPEADHPHRVQSGQMLPLQFGNLPEHPRALKITFTWSCH